MILSPSDRSALHSNQPQSGLLKSALASDSTCRTALTGDIASADFPALAPRMTRLVTPVPEGPMVDRASANLRRRNTSRPKTRATRCSVPRTLCHSDASLVPTDVPSTSGRVRTCYDGHTGPDFDDHSLVGSPPRPHAHISSLTQCRKLTSSHAQAQKYQSARISGIRPACDFGGPAA